MPQLIAGAAIAGGVSSIFTAGSFFSVFATTRAVDICHTNPFF
jgi:hypothetical protein